MAIKHKRKNSAGYTWQTGDLVEGQIGLNIADGTLHFDKADGTTVTIAAGGGGGGIGNVVEDTTPQLGGNLDVNGNSIVSVSNANITIAPNGTGHVHLVTNALRIGDLNTEARISTYGTGNLVLTTNEGHDPDPTITIGNGANADITLTPSGTGDVRLDADTVRIGDSGSEAILTTNGSGGLRISTNDNSTTGFIALNSGADGNITLEPNGTGDVFLNTDTVRVGDENAQARITTWGTGNLLLNTNNGTNSGSITIAQGVNANMTLACNGSGVIVFNSPLIGAISNSAGNSFLQARHIVTASNSVNNPSIIAQKQRSDILLAAMTDEPAVYAFGVRDSASVNRTFGRLIGRYQGTGTNPVFQLQSSVDGFSTTLTVAQFTEARTTLGNAATAQTLTTNGASNLTINTNAGTDSGSIVITQGANGNITITPNGTGNIVLEGVNWPQADGTNGQVLTTNGSGQASWTTVGGSSSQPISILRATSRTTESGTTYRYNFTELGDSTGITSISAGNITIAAAGTYLFEFDANNYSTNPGSSWAIYDATGSVDLRSESTFFGPATSQYLLPPMKAVHTITTTNVYAIRQVDGNLHSDIYLKITKLA